MERDEFLGSHAISDTVKYYLGFIAENEAIRVSVENLEDIKNREKSGEVKISCTSRLTLACLYTFFPWAKRFYIHSVKFHFKIAEEIILKNKMYLINTGWIDFSNLRKLSEIELIKELVISGRERYKNAGAINMLTHFKKIDICVSDKYLPGWIKLLEVLSCDFEKVSLPILKVASLQIVYNSLIQGKLKSESLSLKLNPYSPLFIMVHKAYRQLLGRGIRIEVAISNVMIDGAEKRYKNDSLNKKNAIRLLKAVYELEYATNPSSHATIYDGLSLCQCYLDFDSIDEPKYAWNIYEKLYPNIESNLSDVHIQFLYRCGSYLIGKDNFRAEEMLEQAYYSGKVPSNQRIKCACDLLKAYIFNAKHEEQKALVLLNDLRGSLSDVQDVEPEYITFYFYDMVIEIQKYRNSILSLFYGYPKIHDGHYVEGKFKKYSIAEMKAGFSEYLFYSNYHILIFYISTIYFPLIFVPKENHEKLISSLCQKFSLLYKSFEIVYNREIDTIKNIRDKQSHFHMFKGISMLWLLLSGDYTGATEVAKELLNYKHRNIDRVLNACKFVIQQSQKCNLNLDMESIYYEDFVWMIYGWLWL